MAASPESEELKRRIVQHFRENGTKSSDGKGLELLLKEIWKPLNVEKKAVNRILHNDPCFSKIKDTPPLWQCKIDQTSTSETSPVKPFLLSTTTDTPLDISTSSKAEADVVVKKKEVDSPPKKERLKPDVLRILKDSASPMAALQIAKKIGYGTAGDVNPTLYELRNEDKVIKIEDKWTMKFNSPNTSTSSFSTATEGLHISSTPLRLGEKPLYTREDVYQDGRKETRFREVLPEDVGAKKPAGYNETDASEQPLSPSDSIDEELLGVLSSIYSDHAEFDMVVKIVSMLKASGDTPMDDADIFMKLRLKTREITKPILENLEVNSLVEKIDGNVIQWKWKKTS